MAINAKEKPEMNRREFSRIGFRVRDLLADSSSTDIPVMKERYEGKRGNTHGERNEKAPPRNATKSVT
jgi:hypothetical protein